MNLLHVCNKLNLKQIADTNSEGGGSYKNENLSCMKQNQTAQKYLQQKSENQTVCKHMDTITLWLSVALLVAMIPTAILQESYSNPTGILQESYSNPTTAILQQSYSNPRLKALPTAKGEKLYRTHG